jgi:hypothetical protein
MRPPAEVPMKRARLNLPLRPLLPIPFALGILLAASALGSSLTFANLPSQKENSAYSSDTNLNYWTETFVEATTIPTGLTVVSQTAAVPTRLASSPTPYSLKTGSTVGDAAIAIEFTEQINATVNTEIEIRFTIGEITGAVASVTVYVETQTTIPGGAQTYTFYYDEGASATSTTNFLVQADNQQSLQCASVGSCP